MVCRYSAFSALGFACLLSGCSSMGPDNRVSDLSSITSGDDHVCLLARGGDAHCWGWGGFGQLGAGDTLNYSTPIRVTGGESFVSLASGSAHTCGIVRSGAAFCWGGNAVGALGTGVEPFLSKVPLPVDGGLHFTRISAGTGYTCGVTDDQTGYCWGIGGHGELGIGLDQNTNQPTPVAGNLRFLDIQASLRHTCGLTTSGNAYCWGENQYGKLGTGDSANRSVPTPVAGGVTFQQIGTGDFFSCGLSQAGEAWCWGSNISYELGNGSDQVTQTLVPGRVAGGHTFTTIAVGSYHACGITPEGTLYCWGANTYGKLGDGTPLRTVVPVKVFGDHHFVAITAGSNHTCGVVRNDGPYCWGWNRLGQLGNGSRNSMAVPTPVDPSYRD